MTHHFLHHRTVAEADLGTPRVSKSSIGEGVLEAALSYWADDAPGLMETGIVEVGAGTHARACVDSTEAFHVISGEAVITAVGGPEVTVRQGDVIVMPNGWSGRWWVSDHLRAFWGCFRLNAPVKQQ